MGKVSTSDGTHGPLPEAGIAAIPIAHQRIE
jgi:hypothetical protein